MAGKRLTARDIMTAGVTCVDEQQSLADAARMMRDLTVGCLPICGSDERLKGVITDRDIVLKCVAEGRDPAAMKAVELASPLHWIDADADAHEALESMETHQIKRLPVIDVRGGHQLVGMITEANLAKNLSDEEIAEFASRVYATAR
ncbi:CBS domain-containing protein [Streptomyces sp. UNOC14_S4]|uniref:CBS domain-containing protein n=1 Tax=Streptomyces sp. UNOC14_S4 TaxID=2872340 RepID=UPI001E6164B2|nr:CBS domain-containing protein [Streptomyces sp. UNOC14_S4]MCC3769833.1 CBS domain-containing protein [Streptomyces sp. UNOC14_S4]